MLSNSDRNHSKLHYRKITPCFAVEFRRDFNSEMTIVCCVWFIQMFEHIMEIDREVYWVYGNVSCAGYPLENIDTISDTGQINTDSVLYKIVFSVRPCLRATTDYSTIFDCATKGGLKVALHLKTFENKLSESFFPKVFRGCKAAFRHQQEKLC